MLTVLAIIAAVVLLAVVVILLIAWSKPDTFTFQRSLIVDAPPETIFPLINDYRKWRLWSPYEDRDPNLKRTYSGAEAGTGAVYAWDGNKNIGAGRMETLETTPPNKVVIRLEFFRPFKAKNIAEFTMQPVGNTTNVTWAMSGPNFFIGKVMSVCINMDKMVGKDFEAGLAKLKSVAESGAPA